MREVRGQFVLRSKCGFNAWPSEVYNRAQVAGGQRRQFGPADLLLVCPALYRAATYGSGWGLGECLGHALLLQETWQL